MSAGQLTLRAVSLLAERGAITVTELARSLQIPTSTAHRVLVDCRAVGFAQQQRRGGAYVVGPSLIEAARVVSAESRLRDVAHSSLTWLAEASGEMVTLAVLEGRAVRFVQSVPGTGRGSLGPQNGHVLPAHATAAGKAILSRLASTRVRRQLGVSGRPPAFPGGELWSPFASQLEQVRRSGWAVSRGGVRVSVASVAAPIVMGDGSCSFAVAVVTPQSRLDTRQELVDVAQFVIAAADRIQRRVHGLDETGSRGAADVRGRFSAP